MVKRICNIDPKIKFKNISDLLEVPVVARINHFDEADVKDLAECISKAHNTKQPVIPIIIDSYGGYVYSLKAMIAEIKASSIPVATICIGKAMSCGAVLLTCGSPGLRFIDPMSTVMIHDVASYQSGKIEELKATAAQTAKLQKEIFELMAVNCGHPKNYFLDIVQQKAHADWYLTAKEAKKHNIVDHIRIPQLEVNVSVDISFK